MGVSGYPLFAQVNFQRLFVIDGFVFHILYKETSNRIRICSKLKYSKSQSDVYNQLSKTYTNRKCPKCIKILQMHWNIPTCTHLYSSITQKTIQNEQNMQN